MVQRNQQNNWHIFDTATSFKPDKNGTKVIHTGKALLNLINVKYVNISSKYINGYEYYINFTDSSKVEVYSELEPDEFYKKLIELM